MLSPSSTAPTTHPTSHVSRGANILRLIFHDPFPAFVQSYDSLYDKDHGKFRLEPISHVTERFESCGDCTASVPPVCRILGRTTPPHPPAPAIHLFDPLDGSRAYAAKAPKALRIFFRHDQKLFVAVSSLIFSLIRQFYCLATGSPLLTTSAIIAFQPFGDFLQPNACWHALVLEGGFSPDGRFLFLSIHDTGKLCEAFRRAVLKLLLSKALITEEFASTLLCWKNSGFSIDNQIRINSADHKTRVALAQYIARAPISLQKLSYLPSQGKVRYTSDLNPAIGDTIKIWDVRDFIAAATLFIPPQGVRPLLWLVLLTQPLAVAPLGSYHPSRPARLEESSWGDRCGFFPAALLSHCTRVRLPFRLGKAHRENLRGRAVGLSPLLFKNVHPCHDHRPG